MSRVASCFTDYRDPSAVEHTVQDLMAQRIYGLALGYEDLNDHDQLRRSPLMALLVGKSESPAAIVAGRATAAIRWLHRAV